MKGLLFVVTAIYARRKTTKDCLMPLPFSLKSVTQCRPMRTLCGLLLDTPRSNKPQEPEHRCEAKAPQEHFGPYL